MKAPPRWASCVGMMQSNMSMPRWTASRISSGVPDAHQVARAVPRAAARRVSSHMSSRSSLLSPTARPPMAKPSKGSCVRPSALSRRRSRKSAPCTMANSACGESPRAARLRSAQRWVSSQRRARRRLDPRSRHALVQHHHDVAADRHLRLDAALGAEQNPRSIDVAFERGAVLGHGARVGERENLESARVGEHGAPQLMKP